MSKGNFYKNIIFLRKQVVEVQTKKKGQKQISFYAKKNVIK